MLLTADDIRNCYRIVLGREPDVTGMNTFTSIVAAHKIEDPYLIAKIMFDGEEFKSRHWSAKRESIFADLASIFYHDIDFLLPRSDFSYQTLFHQGAYEPYVADTMFARLQAGQVFLDIGANLGLFALPVAKIVGPQGCVIAVEASQENAKLLLENANRNLIGNIKIFPVGAGDDNGVVLSPRRLDTSDKVLLPPGDLGRYETHYDLVPTIRIDDLLSSCRRKIDTIKIDVEGYEYRVVLGAQNTIRQHGPDIYLEYSDAFQRHGSNVSGAVLLKLLADMGYAFTVLHREKGPEMIRLASVGEEIAKIDAIAIESIAAGGTHLDLMLTPR